MPAIKTASWFGKLPADHVKIGISRGVPRNFPAGSYRRLRALEPGPWFASVAPDEYLRRYNRILVRLVPRIVAADLRDLAGEGRVPVMVCWESAADRGGRELVPSPYRRAMAGEGPRDQGRRGRL